MEKGAPELYDPDERATLPILQAGPNVDVWSLGGVLSEAATWILQNKDGLERYRNMRMSHQTYFNLKDSDCFHDGVDVLPFVTKHHNEIKNIVRKDDYITGKVLELVSHMLTETQSRWDARKLRWFAKDALDRSNGMLTNPQQAFSAPSVSKAKGKESIATSSSAQTDSIPQRNMSLHSSCLLDPAPGNIQRETGSYPPPQCPEQFPIQRNQNQLMTPQWTLSGIQQLRQDHKLLPGPIADLQDRHCVSPTSSNL